MLNLGEVHSGSKKKTTGTSLPRQGTELGAVQSDRQ